RRATLPLGKTPRCPAWQVGENYRSNPLPMNRIVAGAAALNQTPLDWSGDLSRAAAAVASAREEGVGWLCLPELALTGYGCEDMFLSPGVGERALAALLDFAPLCSGLVVAVGLPLWFEGLVFNAVAVILDGEIA